MALGRGQMCLADRGNSGRRSEMGVREGMKSATGDCPKNGGLRSNAERIESIAMFMTKCT